ncbi:hypothetical protein Hanom_Chr04g00291271 [Helianthus anomalus]
MVTSRADICSCLAHLQIESSRADHLKPSLKSNEHFPSNEYSKRASSDFDNCVSRFKFAERDSDNVGPQVFMHLKIDIFHGIDFFL